MKINISSIATISHIKGYLAQKKGVEVNAVIIEDRNFNGDLDEDEAEVIVNNQKISCAEEIRAYRSLWQSSSEQVIEKYLKACRKYGIEPQDWFISLIRDKREGLTFFIYHNYQLSKTGLMAIREALEGYGFFTWFFINMQKNLDQESWGIIANIIENNKNIQYITLNTINVDDSGILYFLNNIRNNHNLVGLDLSCCNKMSDAGFKEVIRAVRANPNIRILSIFCGKIGKETIAELVELIATHPNIYMLEVAPLYLNQEQYNSIIQAFKTRQKNGLPKLYLQYSIGKNFDPTKPFNQYLYRLEER